MERIAPYLAGPEPSPANLSTRPHTPRGSQHAASRRTNGSYRKNHDTVPGGPNRPPMPLRRVPRGRGHTNTRNTNSGHVACGAQGPTTRHPSSNPCAGAYNLIFSQHFRHRGLPGVAPLVCRPPPPQDPQRTASPSTDHKQTQTPTPRPNLGSHWAAAASVRARGTIPGAPARLFRGRWPGGGTPHSPNSSSHHRPGPPTTTTTDDDPATKPTNQSQPGCSPPETARRAAAPGACSPSVHRGTPCCGSQEGDYHSKVGPCIILVGRSLGPLSPCPRHGRSSRRLGESAATNRCAGPPQQCSQPTPPDQTNNQQPTNIGLGGARRMGLKWRIPDRHQQLCMKGA